MEIKYLTKNRRKLSPRNLGSTEKKKEKKTYRAAYSLRGIDKKT